MLAENRQGDCDWMAEPIDMESHLSEDVLWASTMAARLRLLQANFADDAPGMRQDFIVQEIEQSLKGCVPERRHARLQALVERFPAAPMNGQAPAPVAVGAPERELTAEILVEQLIAFMPAMSAEDRAMVSTRLQAAGLTPDAGPAGAFELPPELQKRLGLDGDLGDPARAAKALGMSLDLALTLDQLAWTLWKQIAPKSMVRKEAELPRQAAEYLKGSAEVSTAQLAQTLERTRKLIASLLGAMGRAGGGFAKDRARLFDPNSIAAVATSEKKWNESIEFACWRKYAQLCKEYGAEAAIEKSLQEAWVKATETIYSGRSGI
jgi:hypothetical protein